jgi:hypothetical protein
VPCVYGPWGIAARLLIVCFAQQTHATAAKAVRDGGQRLASAIPPQTASQHLQPPRCTPLWPAGMGGYKPPPPPGGPPKRE